MVNCWQTLGLEPYASIEEVRRAYAALIRINRPDSHPKEFSDIREAYEAALSQLRYAAQRAAQPEEMQEEAQEEAQEEHAESPEYQPDAGQQGVPNTTEHALALVQLLAQAEGDTATTLLEQHLAWLGEQDIDTQLDYEAALLRTALIGETVALPMLLVASARFSWENRGDELTRHWGDGAADRLAWRLELARLHVFAIFFSSNAWLRRLFAVPGTSRPWVASSVHLLAARSFAMHWRKLCEAAALPRLEAMLAPEVVRRMVAPELRSTDLLLAVLAAFPASAFMASGGLPYAGWPQLLVAFAVFALLPALGRQARRLPWIRRPAQHFNLLDGEWIVLSLVGSGVMLILGLVLKGVYESPAGRLAVSALFAGGFAGLVFLVLWVCWAVLHGIEAAVMSPWIRLQSVSDRQMFELARVAAVPVLRRPALAERVRALPRGLFEGWIDARAERKQKKEREKAQGSGKPLSSSGSSFGFGWIWIALMVVGGLVKVLNPSASSSYSPPPAPTQSMPMPSPSLPGGGRMQSKSASLDPAPQQSALATPGSTGNPAELRRQAAELSRGKPDAAKCRQLSEFGNRYAQEHRLGMLGRSFDRVVLNCALAKFYVVLPSVTNMALEREQRALDQDGKRMTEELKQMSAKRNTAPAVAVEPAPAWAPPQETTSPADYRLKLLRPPPVIAIPETDPYLLGPKLSTTPPAK
jgi:hypothetical protein